MIHIIARRECAGVLSMMMVVDDGRLSSKLYP